MSLKFFISTRVPDTEFPTIPHAWGICDIGHQGLMHDEELFEGSIIHNRGRTLHAGWGRFLQHDPIGHSDGMNLYESFGAFGALPRAPSKTPIWSPAGGRSAAENAFRHWGKYRAQFQEFENA